ncbi:MAG: GNAT family N-acetyltransferase [Calditrichaeota bacterium]|nr:MAG: GNAT family N-acetyltransferase [Calditrichota bacterium]
MHIRSANLEDLPFIEKMLFEAFFWQPEMKRPVKREFFAQPEIAKLLGNWGRAGDRAVIAEEDGVPVGAGWFRFGTDEDHSWGYVDEETPELGIGVVAEFRSKGVGRQILKTLWNVAKKDGCKAISLSVAPENFALKLYESEGFVKVGESGTSWTMVLKIEKE